jgi:DNA-binding NarL/FixJ family response regulator
MHNMSRYKVMIVDDSAFSRTIIAETLRQIDCEVVGEADCIDSLVEIYAACKPDFVTMDLILPGADGFECSRALQLYDHNSKIILVSSMKDEETEAEARRVGISGYIQKPLDKEVLLRTINNIMSPDTLYVQLLDRGVEFFKESLAQNFTRMTKSPVTFTHSSTSNGQYNSLGITAIIGIIGRYSGTMILDLSNEVAEKCVSSLLNRPSKSRDETLSMVAELINVIAGVACSMLNKHDKTYKLRVSPPSVFSSNSAEIASPGLKIYSSYVETGFGRIFFSIGFKKGSELWM